jgi:ferredoxin
VKVRIDRERCTGHGRCYALAPDTFDADDDGFGVVRDPDRELSGDELAQAEIAAANCPESAIELVD